MEKLYFLNIFGLLLIYKHIYINIFKIFQNMLTYMLKELKISIRLYILGTFYKFGEPILSLILIIHLLVLWDLQFLIKLNGKFFIELL